MTGQEIVMLIGAIIVVAFIIFCVVAFSLERKKVKADEFSEEEFAEPEFDTFHVKVLDFKCDMHYEGIKMPKLIKNFAVFFEFEDGKVKGLEVPEECYDAFEIGQEGLLTLANEKFISFDAGGEREC